MVHWRCKCGSTYMLMWWKVFRTLCVSLFYWCEGSTSKLDHSSFLGEQHWDAYWTTICIFLFICWCPSKAVNFLRASLWWCIQAQGVVDFVNCQRSFVMVDKLGMKCALQKLVIPSRLLDIGCILWGWKIKDGFDFISAWHDTVFSKNMS